YPQYMDVFFDDDVDIDKINKQSAAIHGLCAVRKKDKFGYIDSTGKFVVKPIFDSASHFLSNDYAEIIYKGKHGWFNKKNNTCFYDPNFEGVVISHNIIFAKQGGKWGIVDENGKFTVEPKFNWVVDKLLCSYF
ncbi:MAG: WG repeat-containing protein, partial [Bacteroidales bacterium]|nr:WG repeat-containing protein [Bacteroidales bacterium]